MVSLPQLASQGGPKGVPKCQKVIKSGPVRKQGEIAICTDLQKSGKVREQI